MRPESPAIAVLCADIHLSHKPPLARTAEDDWYEVTGRVLRQLVSAATTTDGYLLPIVCSGDLFDKWNPPPELINFVLEHSPHLYAVPGQHDLPLHRYDLVKKSAYWTLVEAGVVTTLKPDKPVEVSGRTPLRLHGFPFGFPVKPLEEPHDLTIEVAVVHDYFWKNSSTSFPDAPPEKRASSRWEQLRGYDVIVTGDNHIPFKVVNDKQTLWNCGGLFRRRSDEIDHDPSVGILHADGTVTRRKLDCSEDKFLDVDELVVTKEFMDSGFLDELAKLGDSALDFGAAMKYQMDKLGDRVSPAVKEAILRAMGEY